MMIIHGTNFSAVLTGRVEMFTLKAETPGHKQISIQFADGCSIIADQQPLDVYPVAAEGVRQ